MAGAISVTATLLGRTHQFSIYSIDRNSNSMFERSREAPDAIDLGRTHSGTNSVGRCAMLPSQHRYLCETPVHHPRATHSRATWMYLLPLLYLFASPEDKSLDTTTQPDISTGLSPELEIQFRNDCPFVRLFQNEPTLGRFGAAVPCSWQY
jgi:hypothetical protein